MAATSITPLFTRLKEVLIEGFGTAPYTIATKTFSDWWYEGDNDTKRLSLSVLSKPQIKYTLEEFQDAKAWARPSNQTMYNAKFKIALAYYTDEKLLKAVENKLTTRIGDDIHKIAKALQYPGNLSKTEAGFETGLAGGLLEQEPEPADFFWDRDTSVVTGNLIFAGKIVLSHTS